MATASESGEVRVYVGKNLPQSIRNHHLRSHFEDVKDDIKQCYVAFNKGTKQSKGFGFIMFKNIDAAKRAIKKYNGTMLQGVSITVQLDIKEQKKLKEQRNNGRRSRTFNKRSLSHPQKIEVKQLPSRSTNETMLEYKNTLSDDSSQDETSSIYCEDDDISVFSSQLSYQDSLLGEMPACTSGSIGSNSVEKRTCLCDGEAATQADQRTSMSEQLFMLFKEATASDVQKLEASVDYDNVSKEIVVRSMSIEAQRLMSELINEYDECILPITIDQYNSLMKVQEDGSSQFEDLFAPFSNINIMPIKQGKQMHLTFMGRIDVVYQARSHAQTYLVSKKIEVEWMKLIALQRLYDLSNCRASITFHETTIELDGQQSDILTTRDTLVSFLDDIEIVQHPTLLSSTLCQSFNKNIKLKNMKAVIINESGVTYVCSAGAEAARYTKNHIKNPIKATVCGASPDCLLSLHSEVAKIETENTVEITMRDKQTFLVWGYVSTDVKKAKEALIEIVKVQRALTCSPPIALYLHHILFVQERSSSVQSFVSSLQAQILSVSGQLLLEGNAEILKDIEDKLIEHFSVHELIFESVSYDGNSRFISQLKQDYLQPLKKRFNFIYIITNQSEKNFTVTIYSKNHEDFKTVITNMKAIEPSTCKIAVSSEFVEQILALKQKLEQKHKVRLFIHKSEPAVVMVHGLKLDQVIACEDEIKQCLVISRKIPLTGYQVKYLKCKCTEDLKQWTSQCKNLSLPPRITNLSKPYFLSVVGTEDNVNEIEQEVYDIVGQDEQFFVENFEIKCPFHYLIIWKRRWLMVKQEIEKELDVVLEFSETSESQQQKEKKEDHVINFIIYGPNADVRRSRDIIEKYENGSVIKETIRKPNNDRLDHPSVVSKELEIDKLFVWLQFRVREVIITAPASVPEDLKVAKMRMLSYIQNTVTKEEVIICSDEVICLIISALCSQYAEEYKVSIDVNVKTNLRINGPKEAVTQVTALLQSQIIKLKREIKSESFVVDAVMLPHLKSDIFRKFVAEIKHAHHVIISIKSVSSPHYASLESSQPRVLKWYWLGDGRNFTPYNEEINSKITSCYLSAPTQRHILTINDFRYYIDFNTMKQVNATTNYSRSIKMEQEYENIDEASAIQITVRGKINTLDLAMAKITTHCFAFLKTDKISILSCTDYLRASLKHIANQHQVRVSFKSTESRTVAIVTGVDNLVSESVADMQREVICHMETRSVPFQSRDDTQVSYPDEWQPQTKTVKLYELLQSSNEWRSVALKFQATLNGFTINKIQRIQNKWIWQKYVQHKKMMAEKNGKDGVNEKELFHGTRTNDPGLIYDSEEGFDMRYSDRGLWGQANYFAENSRYSNHYAHTTATGHKQMFLVKVLTGESASIPQDRSLRMPPDKKSGLIGTLLATTNEVQLGKMKYDSVCGSTGGSTVYMTYDNLKAYPAYLITYHVSGEAPERKRSFFGLFKF